MAIPTRTITGTIYLPNAIGAPGGTLRAALSHAGKVTDDAGPTEQKVSGEKAFAIGEDGVVTLNLIPNDKITPDGTHYRVTISLANGFTWVEFWSVPTGAGNLDIGAVPLVAGTTPSPGFIQVTSVGALPTAGPEWGGRLAWLHKETEADVAFICMQKASGVWEWSQVSITGP